MFPPGSDNRIQPQQDIRIGSSIFHLVRNPDGTYTSTPIISETEDPSEEPNEIEDLEEGKVLAEYVSKSNPNEIHRVKYSKQLGFYCTCIGFGVHKHCWHILDTLIKLEEATKNDSSLLPKMSN